MTTEAATIRFTLQAAEAYRASRLQNRTLFRVISVIPLILFVIGLVVLLLIGLGDALTIVLPMWAIGAFLVLIPALTVRGARRKYPEIWVQETVITLDDAGMRSTRGMATTDRRWAGVTDYIEDSEFIVIRQGRLPVAFIPKRAFTDATDQDSFLTVLRTHLTTEQGRAG